MLVFVLACVGKSGEELHVPLGPLLPEQEELEERVKKLLSAGCVRVRLQVELYYVRVLKEWMG